MLAHGLFFIGENLRYMSVDAAMEIKLTTTHEVFDFNASLDMEYDYLDEEQNESID